MPVLVASALGVMAWVSAFGHGSKYTPSPGVRATERGSRGRQRIVCRPGCYITPRDETADQ